MRKRKPQPHTQQRQVMPEEFAKLTPHPTAGELCGLVRASMPKISLGTAGRELEPLAHNQIVLRLGGSGSEAIPHPFPGKGVGHPAPHESVFVRRATYDEYPFYYRRPGHGLSHNSKLAR